MATIKWALSLFALLGITSTVGAIQHGTSPSGSITMAVVALALLLITNKRTN